MKSLSREEMVAMTQEFRQRLREDGEKLDALLPEAFALVREASRRTLDKRHFDVQLIGGVVLHQGNVAEMKTGEGKTFVGPLAAYLNALDGEGVHVVTVNDYLVRRDCEWMGQVYDYVGLSVGCLQHESSFIFDPAEDADFPYPHLRPISRPEAYMADITYGTNNEFGFDYLRDNMARESTAKVQRTLNYAIVDEVDNILIDEARTPLIISGQAEQNVGVYTEFARHASRMQEGRDYVVNLKHRSVNLTEEGINLAEQILRIPETESLYDPRFFEQTHFLDNALKAKALYLNERDYTIVEGEVIIVDEFTGRLMQGRRYSEGLHQAIEAKEGVRVERESQTLATVTIQNYFRMYRKLAGMTGTAHTEAEEFGKIYNVDVVQIPTNQNMIRHDSSDRIYKSEQAKFKAVADEIQEMHTLGRPVLVGTTSIEKSERLSDLLRRRGIQHEVLNAKLHEREELIVAEAGQPRAVTIATNMAGRGTDILLGEGVPNLGGLHIIGTERHESRRIDNQLRGRAGRQGDPGSTRFYVSLEDELMVRFGLNRVSGVMDRLGVGEDTPIEAGIVTRQIEGAQAKAEGHNFDIRKHVVQYDSVMNRQREVIYEMRDRILVGDNTRQRVMEMVHHELDSLVDDHTDESDGREWNPEALLNAVNTIFPLPENVTEESLNGLDIPEMKTFFHELADEAYDHKEAEFSPEVFRDIERWMLLNTIDTHWVEYLTTIEELRQGIGLRAYAQRDPLVEYKTEAYNLFEELVKTIEHDVAMTIYKVTPVAEPIPEVAAPRAISTNRDEPVAVKTRRNADKVGRNDPCPCGSGKKYKRCHGASTSA